MRCGNVTVEGSPSVAAATERRLLFISHANPQDNAAASWFATQLTLLGYEVWCDLKNTHGGESGFWLKVQNKIENEAAKFIFILSNHSRDFEKKPGVYKEVQAADNVRLDRFIVPLRIEKLTGSVPIIIGPDIYINSENWAEGLRELLKRLINDRVPRTNNPDYEKIVSWWPATTANTAIVTQEPATLTSNVLKFEALPSSVHFLKVMSEGNILTGRDQLKGALPSFPPYSAHGNHAVSFACANDFQELTRDFEITDDIVLETEEFLKGGSPDLGISSQTAQNTVTYLLATAFEKFLADKGLRNKEVSYSRRKIWFPPSGLLPGNKFSYGEPGQRKAPIWFVGEISHFKKKFAWHFAVQPTIDLRIHAGIVLTPKAIITAPYRPDQGERPVPLDEKRVLKKLTWWNKAWRGKVVALAAWLGGAEGVIKVPFGYQELRVAAAPETFLSAVSLAEKSDDAVIREILGLGDA
jgi:hypothetical protein